MDLGQIGLTAKRIVARKEEETGPDIVKSESTVK